MITKIKTLFVAITLAGIFCSQTYAQNGNRLTGISIQNPKWYRIGDYDKVFSSQDPIVLYEGNGCSQEKVGSLPLSNIDVKFPGLQRWFDNDEARSLVIRSDDKAYGLPVRPGTRIMLYDNSDAKTSDDWVEITLKQDTASQGALCIADFEQDYEDSFVKIVYHKRDNLNGKVSHAKVRLP